MSTFEDYYAMAQPPGIGDTIRCCCHGKGCKAGVMVNDLPGMVELVVKPERTGPEISVILDWHSALDLALVLQEVGSDARAAIDQGRARATKRD